MKLWAASVEFQIVVIAENAEEAREIATNAIGDEVKNIGDEAIVEVQAVHRRRDVDPSWLASLPYRGPGDYSQKNVEEILRSEATP